ncbi:MAG TPA: hypothetical protein PLG50_02560 [bacterium]|nr:hypothetical protein [bacterium]HQG44526.1 hypothetical protein [bacterium]HQJ63988.1 hypothetical protein [bacterium]
MKKEIALVAVMTLWMSAAGALRAAQNQPASPSCLLRVDYHYGEINPWLFYERPIAKDIGLSVVVQMSTQGFAQIDLGSAFHRGNLALIPEFGFEFIETGAKGARLGHVAPEFFATYNDPAWTFESQNLYFIKVADETYPTYFYYRDYLGHRLYRDSFIGPQVEGNIYRHAAPDHYFGGHLDVSIGVGLLGLFYGQNRDDRGLFRMTFIRGL